jgi:hypothetical protein
MYFYLISIFEDVAGINLSCAFVFFFLYRCQKIPRIRERKGTDRFGIKYPPVNAE